MVPGSRFEGTVELDGRDIYDRAMDPVELRRRVGMVFQKPNPFPTMSIRDNVLAGLKLTNRLDAARASEDIAENYYRLDRMIWNLIQAGYDKSVQGILLGSLHLCGRDDAGSFGQKRFIESLQRLCAGPILMNCRFGHGFREKNNLQRLLPLGVKMGISGKKISYREPFVTTTL
jgi:ABC-type sugar transport system ATPase subunit